MALKGYEELRKLDVSKYVKKRDGVDYLNWATVVDLLHQNGANVVYFEPIADTFGSSLIMSDKEFTTGKQGLTNRVYETAIKIVIDDLEFIQRGPVMNGSNPVQDNSMTQQRLWNCQTRLFVKGVAIRTGLGFDLWSRQEIQDEDDTTTDDLSKHSIFKIQERMEQLITSKIKAGLSLSKMAENLGISEEELKANLTYYKLLDRLEKRISEMKP